MTKLLQDDQNTSSRQPFELCSTNGLHWSAATESNWLHCFWQSACFVTGSDLIWMTGWSYQLRLASLISNLHPYTECGRTSSEAFVVVTEAQFTVCCSISIALCQWWLALSVIQPSISFLLFVVLPLWYFCHHLHLLSCPSTAPSLHLSAKAKGLQPPLISKPDPRHEQMSREKEACTRRGEGASQASVGIADEEIEMQMS